MEGDPSHMRRYDPDEAPRASAWLALDEGERLRLVEQYHHREDPELPNVKLHSSIHVIVENQLAEGLPASRRAFERVRREGLSRHDAIHAVGSVVAEHLVKLLNEGKGGGDHNAALERALNELTAEQWLAT
jgi:hypothetical protein